MTEFLRFKKLPYGYKKARDQHGAPDGYYYAENGNFYDKGYNKILVRKENDGTV